METIIIIIGLIILCLVGWICIKDTKNNSTSKNIQNTFVPLSNAMTFMEIETKLNNLFNEYNERLRNLTSVQQINATNTFAAEKNISILPEDDGDNICGYKLVLNYPIAMHEECTVKNVIEGLSRRCLTIDVILSSTGGKWQFFAPLDSGAEQLNVGQKITIQGFVVCRIGIYRNNKRIGISPKPAQNGIQFNII